MNTRQARWLTFLSEYNFKVKHIKGKEDNFAYALGCIIHLLVSQTSYDVHDKIREASKNDRFYVEISQKNARKQVGIAT